MYIEYDGEGNFKTIRCGNSTEEEAIERLKETQINDETKNEHCKENCIPLLRIKYLDFLRVKELITEFVKNNSGMSTVDAGVGVVIAV